jgi:cytochrome c
MTLTSPRSVLLVFSYLACALLSPLAHAGDAAAGKTVYEEECSECHSIEGKNKKGPTLVGVVGRKAGTIADFDYSPEMKASGLSWSEDNLDKYLTAPRKFVQGAKMKYDGLQDATARGNLIAFLAALK